jgi:hypothetical protein
MKVKSNIVEEQEMKFKLNAFHYHSTSGSVGGVCLKINCDHDHSILGIGGVCQEE